MKRKLLLALMVAVLLCSFMLPASAGAAAWTKANFAQNLLNSLDDSFDYGLIAEDYTQEGHSEANIYVDKLTKTATDPILASTAAAPVYALVTLPDGHTADNMTFGLYLGTQRITTQTVNVSGKTQVFVTFPADASYNQYAGKELTIRQIRDDNSIVNEAGVNDDQMTVSYGKAVKTSGSTGSYIGSIIAPETFRMFNAGVGKSLTLGSNVAHLLSEKVKWGQYPTSAYHPSSLFNGKNPISLGYGFYYSIGEGFDSAFYYPTVDGTEGQNQFSKVYIKADESQQLNKEYLTWQDLLFCINQNKFYKEDKESEVTVNYTSDTTLASKRLEKLTDLSIALANSKLGLGGRAKSLGTIPSAEGNSTVTTGKSSNGTVVSLYNVTVGYYNGSNGEKVYYIDRSSMLPENENQASEVFNKGLPLAANEYAVMNVVVPDDADTITLDQFGISLINSDGSKDLCDSRDHWLAGLAQNFNRIIWNFVTLNGETGKYEPYTGTIKTGTNHGGMVLVPKGIIENQTGDAVTLVAKKVTSHGEIHHNSATPDSTTVTMRRSSAPDKTSVSVTKIWVDNNNQDGIRPTEITVELLADGKDTGKSIKLNANNNWTGSFTNLDVNANGKRIEYTVKEVIVIGYSQTISGNANEGYTITNTHTPEVTSVSGTKTWNDGNNQDNKRPTSITVRLYANGEEIDSVVVSEGTDGKWAYSFDNLPKYSNGQEIKYTVNEDAIANYSSKVTGYDITNTYTTETVSVSGGKTWADNNNQDGKRPTSITINLLADGVQVDSKTVTAANDWKWEFTGLPKYNGGKEIKYTVTENAVANYVAAVNGYDVTNTYTTETVNVYGGKTWADNNNQDGKRPTSITINLLADGVQVDSKTVTAANDWKWEFTGLPKYNGGKEIKYTITENAVANYVATVDGYNITNTYTTATVNVSGGKTWADNNNQDGKRPTSITINLLADGVQVDSKTVTAANDWKWEFTGLPKYNGGKEIKYTITENAVANYVATVDGYNITNTYTTETVNVSGGKTWADNNNQDGKRPTSITINLLADGAQVDTKTVTAADNWAWNFTNLPKYNGGKEIKYTITENAVANYVATVNGYDVTNTYTTETVNVSGGKTWADNNNQDGKRPTSITINLLADGVQVDSKTVTAANDWKWNFTNLPKYNGGKEIKYTITENAVANYVATVNGYNVTNTYTTERPALAELMLQKADRLNPEKKLEGAEYTLYTDEACENVMLLNGEWAIFRTGKDGIAKLTGLPAGTYWVKETKAPVGYEVDPVPYRVDVVLNPEKPKLVEVSDFPLRGALCLSKTVAGYKTDAAFRFDIMLTMPTGDPIVGSYDTVLNGKTGAPVQFTAVEGGAKATVTLKDGDTLTIKGLRSGVKYTVTETTTHGYDVTVNGTAAAAASGTISDTTLSVAKFHNSVKLTSFQVQKVWRGMDKGEQTPGIQLTLYCNGQVYSTKTPTADKNGWYTYTGLPAYVNGEPAVYTVKETPVTGYTTTYLNKGEHANASDCAYNGGVIENCKVPQTGDGAPLMLWAMLMLTAACGLWLAPRMNKRHN